VNAKGKYGSVTALSLAIQNEYPNIVSMLLDKGAKHTPILSEEKFKLCEASPGEPPQCGISFDELKRHETVKLPGKNNVCYHRSHMQTWLKEKKTNPLTRERIPDKWIIENYPYGLEYNYEVEINKLLKYKERHDDTINFEIVRDATQRGGLPDAAKRIFNFEPGEGPNIRDFLFDNRPGGGKRKSKKARKVRANKSKKVKKQNI